MRPRSPSLTEYSTDRLYCVRHRKLLQIDYGGALLSSFATVLVILPLNWGGVSFPWVSGPVLGCLISGIVGYGVFVVYEWRVAKIPIVPRTSSFPSLSSSPRLASNLPDFLSSYTAFIFKNQTVSAVFASTFLNGATILTQVRSLSLLLLVLERTQPTLLDLKQVYYLPQFFQVVRGDSPIRSGVLILPQLTMTTFAVFVSGQLVARTGEYKVRPAFPSFSSSQVI